MGEVGSVEVARSVKPRRSWVRVGLVAGVAVAATVAMIVMTAGLLPPQRAVLRLRNALPPGEEFASINRVSHWPADWVAAVCEPPLYRLRTPYSRLPHATAAAVCRALVTPDGDVAHVLVARFPAELPMQVDLVNDGYQWYAFTVEDDEMVVFATFSGMVEADHTTSVGEPPALRPLKRFGFTIYSSPGP
ncbi:hypothetical protein [Mycolicibacterium fortuitum]|uniref:hypothetical protein n=1 Tax=Mycolicibacterium fortuitum TaxID=1766 RepID=UPI001CDC4CCA|nr:hypothetical protein [Mycolicibacterium fortuitum]UBV18083.1 hypothetical protein H8Z57_15585 [Mycolicibacterium fortuitum]